MNRNRKYIDGLLIEDKLTFETEICIVGAGAAGITLASEFANQDYEVLLIESGGEKFSHRNQKLGTSQSIGKVDSRLEFSRRRQLGGTTVVWSGKCRPLDNIDFEKRDWIHYSGWPYSKSALDPYYLRSWEYCDLSNDDFLNHSNTPNKWFDNISQNSEFGAKVFLFSPPTNFATKYAQSLENTTNMQVMLNSNAVFLNLNGNGNKVDSITCKSNNGNTFTITAKVFILAAGALEITRLLLSSNDIQENGVGNQNDLVGRYFMDRVYLWSGVFEEHKNKDAFGSSKFLTIGRKNTDLSFSKVIGIKENIMSEHKLTNAVGFLSNRSWFKVQDPYFESIGIAFQNVYDVLRHFKYPDIKFFLQNCLTIMKQFPSMIKYIFNILFSIFNNKKYVGIISQFEQVPNPDSRVTLSAEKNLIGQPKLIINRNLMAQDLENIDMYHQRLKSTFDKLEIPFKLHPMYLDKNGYPNRLIPGKHFMGTTRMNNNPKEGVVDENAKVHNISNLYISSSSVFPTSGSANPTLTIVALAIKLADHIKDKYFN